MRPMLIDPSLSIVRRGSEPISGGYRLIRRDIEGAPDAVIQARGYDYDSPLDLWVAHPWDIDDPTTWLPQMMTQQDGQPIIPAWPGQRSRDLYYGAVADSGEIYMSVGEPSSGGQVYFLRTEPAESDRFIDVQYVAAQYGVGQVSVQYATAAGEQSVIDCSVAVYVERDGDSVRLSPRGTSPLWVRRGFSGDLIHKRWDSLNWAVKQVSPNEVTLSLKLPDPLLALSNSSMGTITWLPLLLDGTTHEEQGVRVTVMGNGRVLPVEDGTGIILSLRPGERRAIVAAPLWPQDRQLYASQNHAIPSCFELDFIPRHD